ncbi:DUF6197 family protein [Rhodococcus sp. NPDC003994]
MTAAVADVLDAAGDIVQNGWTRFRYRSGDGCYCALGAITEAADRLSVASSQPSYDRFGVDIKAGARLAAVLGIPATSMHIGIPRWNDDPDRTQDEVVTAFRTAAAQERQATP